MIKLLWLVVSIIVCYTILLVCNYVIGFDTYSEGLLTGMIIGAVSTTLAGGTVMK